MFIVNDVIEQTVLNFDHKLLHKKIDANFVSEKKSRKQYILTPRYKGDVCVQNFMYAVF